MTFGCAVGMRPAFAKTYWFKTPRRRGERESERQTRQDRRETKKNDENIKDNNPKEERR
jgi:hypothetical protein